MNPVRKRRLIVIVMIVAAAALAVTLLSMALQRNVAYLYTPSEVLRGEAGDKARFPPGWHGGGALLQARDRLARSPLRSR